MPKESIISRKKENRPSPNRSRLPLGQKDLMLPLNNLPTTRYRGYIPLEMPVGIRFKLVILRFTLVGEK